MNQTAGERTAATVRAELARQRITGRELSRELKWSATSTWRRLSGDVPFDIDELAAIGRVLNVPLCQLVTDAEPADALSA